MIKLGYNNRIPRRRSHTMNELYSNIEEVKLTYKNRVKAANRPEILSPQTAYELFLKHWDNDQIDLLEEGRAMFLDSRLRLMSMAPISKGSFDTALIDLRHVFSIALKRRADSIIIAHNHPSGSLIPSRADIQLTKTLKEAGELLNIPVQDHLIITKDGFCSMVTEGHF